MTHLKVGETKAVNLIWNILFCVHSQEAHIWTWPGAKSFPANAFVLNKNTIINQTKTFWVACVCVVASGIGILPHSRSELSQADTNRKSFWVHFKQWQVSCGGVFILDWQDLINFSHVHHEDRHMVFIRDTMLSLLQRNGISTEKLNTYMDICTQPQPDMSHILTLSVFLTFPHFSPILYS